MRINTRLSSPLMIKHGLPQGSILGPLLFNLYINDLPSICEACKVESYVDDSRPSFFCNKDTGKCLEGLRRDLLGVAWCCLNRLLLNPEKTKFLVLGCRQMLSRTTVPPIMFLEKELSTVDSAKDLGVVLDSQTSFNEDINSLVSSHD